MGTLEISPGIFLDARRAVWLPGSGILAVADTHLGFAWVQRRRGQLVPITRDDTASRLEQLAAHYSVRTVVILGDVVHEAVAGEVLSGLLQELCDRLVQSGRQLVFVLGNHDRGLPRQVQSAKLPVSVVSRFSIPGFEFVHGDQPQPADLGGQVLSGHEHPSLVLGDGVATRAKVPCFLVAPRAILLPAFSEWAAGTIARPGQFLGPVANETPYTSAVACLGPRLLRLVFPLPASATPHR